MKHTGFSNILSMAAMLLVSFPFGESVQAYSPPIPTVSAVPDAISGFPGATAEWWAAVQAQLQQELGIAQELSTTADWIAVGEALYNYFGTTVASAGDVNGDGYADLAVAAPGYGYNNNTGKVYVFHGSARGLSITPDWSAVGETFFNFFGRSVASAGDVNGDGFADLAVGADCYNNCTGKAYVYHGSVSGLSLTADWTAVGEDTNWFGNSVASAGDVNGDGFADLAVGAHRYNNYTGKAYVYHGSAGGLSLTPDWSMVGEAADILFGYSVASAGDVNGDGYADLAVGAFGYNNYAGKVYVYHGSAGGLSLAADWSAVGETFINYFGSSVASAGDVNGDGYSDLAVGAELYDSYKGKAYVYQGSAGGLSLTADWNAVGEVDISFFGESVASAGDVNGDGYADLVVGASGYNPRNNERTGKAYVYHGSPGGLSLTPDWSAVGEAVVNYFGESVASAGDVNGDGYADLVVGAGGNKSFTGKAYVYYGSAVPAGCTTSCLQVAAIGMWVDPSFVYATVTVRDENGAAVPAAKIFAHWDLPGVGSLEQTRRTGASGSAAFKVSGGAGTYTITITDVTKAGYTFDPENSAILSKSINK